MIKISQCSTKEFIQLTESHKIICFCAGLRFVELCDKYDLSEKILYVVDNHKYGTAIQVGGREIPVRSMDEIGAEVGNCVLVITSMKYADVIIRQLDGIRIFDGLTFYITRFFNPDNGKLLIDISRPQMIPRVINYTWFGRNKMPDRFCQNIESWEKHCPGYQIVRWDEDNYDVTKNRYMRQAYEAGKWGFVSDYARLDIINRYGGVYLDTDVELLKPLDSLLGYPMFCGFEKEFEDVAYAAFGLGFGAVKDTKILQEILEIYETIEFVKSDGTWNLLPSPFYQTYILEKHGLVRDGNTQVRDEFIALSPQYLAPFNLYGMGEVTEETISIHQYSATWFGRDNKDETTGLIDKAKFIAEHCAGR